MFKSLLGISPTREDDGSFRPSWLALKLATSAVSDYRQAPYTPYAGTKARILVLCTEQKNMTMQNGCEFSTGNHPVEMFVPMLHLQQAGFVFDIVTPTGQPVALEQWAMPRKDEAVMGLYDELASELRQPKSLSDAISLFRAHPELYGALFIPGGHGAMLGLPDDPLVGELLREAEQHELFVISLCHGPGAFLASAVGNHAFIYTGYEMAVFPDAVDKKTPMIGYLPGQMPWHLGELLTEQGARIVNTKGDKTCCRDRRLITGASPASAEPLGRLAAKTLLDELPS